MNRAHAIGQLGNPRSKRMTEHVHHLWRLSCIYRCQTSLMGGEGVPTLSFISGYTSPLPFPFSLSLTFLPLSFSSLPFLPNPKIQQLVISEAGK